MVAVCACQKLAVFGTTLQFGAAAPIVPVGLLTPIVFPVGDKTVVAIIST